MIILQKRMIYLLALLFVNITVIGQDYEKYGVSKDASTPTGLGVGELAPDFSGINQHDKTVNLYDELEKGKIVLIFYRGYWCPVCNRYLNRFQDSLNLIKDSGAEVIAITPETAENISKTIENVKANFNIISDQGNKIIDAYKVGFKVTNDYSKMIEVHLNANIAETNNQQNAYLPVPATFIINGKGIIEYVQFDPNYNNRASIREILENL